MFEIGNVVKTINKSSVMDKIDQSFVIVEVLSLAIGGDEDAYIFKGIIDKQLYNRSSDNMKIDEQYYRKRKLQKICSKLETK